MTAQAIRVVCRIDKHTGEPILFLPDSRERPGFIAYYTRVGQHATASTAYYYRNTRPAKGDECADLVREYESIPGGGRVVVRQRIR
jgi:hypothetical protein